MEDRRRKITSQITLALSSLRHPERHPQPRAIFPDVIPISPAEPTRAHHRDEGGFRNPWPGPEHGLREFLRWRIDRLRTPPASELDGGPFPLATPAHATPRARPGQCSVTWVGHSTTLVQLGAVNVLTDPVWSDHAAPLPGLGPRRRVPPGIDFAALPPIDLVLLSHNHYDHLDDRTVRRLIAAQPSIEWIVPLGLAEFVRARGATRVTQFDWWEEREIAGARIACTPARHFSARGLLDRFQTLWAGFVVRVDGHAMYFAGDTATHPEFARIGERFGPFDITLLPVGAYEPRWFMGPVHMNPEDAVSAYQELQAAHPSARPAAMVGIHWGTFKLTDEPLREPPTRTRASWERADLPADQLWILQHGETRWR